MVYNKFRAGLLLRLLFSFLFITIAVFCFFVKEWYYSAFIFSVLSVTLFAELVYFIEKYFRNLNEFLEGFKYKDFTKSWQNNKDEGHIGVQKKLFNELNKTMLEIRIEKQAHYEYLQFLIEHLKIAIISFDEEDTIILSNTQAKNLLGIQLLTHLSVVKRKHEDLYSTFRSMVSGETRTVQLKMNNEYLQLLVRSTVFYLMEKKHTLISFQNIKHELDEKEFESWNRLIRILNHEIMNSVTPISSMSSELKTILPKDTIKDFDLNSISRDNKKLIFNGIDVIEKRSKALLSFISNYRNISHFPKPSFSKVEITSLIEQAIVLFEPEVKKKNIAISFTKNLNATNINADKGMIEQVLINLIMNSINALSGVEKPKITIDLNQFGENVVLKFEDNGIGIPKENIDKIFVPFFTTKNDGSGIGLSISKQIMLLHKSDISVYSNGVSGTIFTLKFPNYIK